MSTTVTESADTGDTADEDGPAEEGFLLPLIVGALADAVERGLPPQTAVELAPDVFTAAMPRLIKILVTGLHRSKSGLIRDLAADRAAFTSHLEATWATAFGGYEAAAYAAYEFGGQLHERRAAATDAVAAERSDDSDELVLDALSLLHGRACTVAQEVLWLLRGGYADGAAARQRTLHELAVVLTLITQHPQHDLADRYLEYVIVEQREDMRLYQLHAQALGQTPLTQQEVDAIETQFQEVLGRRGPGFKRPYQWAEPLFPGDRDVTFSKLETRAGLGHLRPYYRYANHAVHAGPRAAVLNLYPRGGQWAIGTGARADVDIAEIAHASLISLLQCTVALLPDGDAVNLDDLVLAQALQQLVDDAGTAFARAARRLPS